MVTTIQTNFLKKFLIQCRNNPVLLSASYTKQIGYYSRRAIPYFNNGRLVFLKTLSVETERLNDCLPFENSY
jgi:hypothetical protein